MNRRMMVRGQSLDNGEWVYGYLIGANVIVGDIVEFTDEYFNTEYWCMVDPETVGRFTGCYDWNGEEIYDGDIVRLHDPSETKNGYISRVSASPVFGARVDPHPVHVAIGASTGKRPLYNYCSYGISEELDVMCEIIGNVYEHPHLLSE